MKQATITISKKQNGKTEKFDTELYNKLKRALEEVKHGRVSQIKTKKVDWKEVKEFRKAFEDIKHGRLSEWKPNKK
ncbi:MAG: hypothetical protein Q7S21_06070 [archaeon]|nr:hypothetical protein [archaeon]